jgi:predicted dehydrogenase
LAALVDPDVANREKAAKLFPEAKTYTDIASMMSEVRPDIVSIATPTDKHREHIIEVIGNGGCQAIFCEKPVAANISESEEVVALCKKSGVKLFIGHQRHFDPLLNKWAKKVREGCIGDPLGGNVTYYNGLYNNGTHWIDLLQMFLGAPVWVIGCNNSKTTAKADKKNIDGLIGFKNGAIVSLQSLSENYGHSEFMLWGEAGMIHIGKLGFEVELRNKIPNRDFKGVFELQSPGEKEGEIRSMLLPAVEHICLCLDGQAEAVSTGDDGLADLQILKELENSADQGSKKIILTK